ncbi:TPA: formate/nitrite transporter family protein [Streptococcus suis]|uniref:formate/nitrite transporter family protein n=1 Tax=Streptococcus suis TaxID=1307 RepID=UPI0009444ACF|nr:formate/nitrite transporter family protein [Streptococcus suis]MCO0798023.1 formate/nitrite transporter family protein [Streptococcus suis]MCO0809820.1 formate/nitrite transporter family protein [Streptococcus suis]MCO0844721.1 formate/nitrite transporter family protein [Streptococcus suis]HEL1591135.1 formate/nitrite transporter family protein [Streptococcus suis]HEL2351399.1 formate/nitrite transporter family protein [Streptococcus suis]
MGANQETLMYTLEKSIKKKADLFEHSFSAYAVRSILASLYLGLGIVISLYTADKLNHVAEGLGKFSYGLMFGWGLLMILYMNAELGTSNMMYMTVASHRKTIPTKTALKMLATCILFNFVGAVLVCYLVSLTLPYQHVDAHSYLFEATVAKLSKTPLTQFIEGIFAFLGYEHVIANFSLFSLAFFSNGGPVEGMTLLSVLSNFLFSGLGNYVGGGLFIGLLYSWLNNQSKLYVD